MYINEHDTYVLCTFNRPAVWGEIEDLLYFVVIKNATESANRTISQYHVAHVNDNYALVDANSNVLGRVALRNNNTALVLVPSGHLDTVVLGAALQTEGNVLTMPGDGNYAQLPMIFRRIDTLDSCSAVLYVEDIDEGEFKVEIWLTDRLLDLVDSGVMTADSVTLSVLPVDTPDGDSPLTIQQVSSIVDELLKLYYTGVNITVISKSVDIHILPEQSWNLLTGEVS